MKLYNRLYTLAHNKTVRNGSFFAIFSFFNKGIAFILLTIIARYITPNDYGELSLFNTLITLLGYFVGLSTAGYLSVSFFKESKDKFKEDFSAIILITVIVSSIILIISLFSYQWLSTLLRVSVKDLFIAIIISFFSVVVGMNLDYYRVKEKLSIYGILSCGFALINFAFTLYFIIVLRMNWHGQVYALLIANVLFGLIAIVSFFKNKLFVLPKTKGEYKKIIIWGLPIIPHLASNWIKQGLDRYIIEDTHSMADVGLFSFALNLVSVIIMIGIAFNQTNSVNIYQTLSSSDSATNKMSSLLKKERYLSFLYLILTVIVILCGVIIVPLLMPNYSSCIPYFAILSACGYFQCVYFLYCNYLFYFDNTKQLMYITFGSSILHLTLSLLLTKYSLYLTCVIYVVSMIFIVMLVYQQSRKLLKEKLFNNENY